MAEKMWGGEPFWGLSYDWDPDWVLTERQQELRAKLIDLCEQEMRANAKRSDDELLYPRRNFEILAENGFLPDRSRGVRRPRREPRGLRHGLRDARPLRLCLDRHVLRDAHAAPWPRSCCGPRLSWWTSTSGRSTTARSARSPIRTRRPARTSGTRSRPAPSAQTAATRSTRRPPGRPPEASPTSTWCRPRAPTSRATTICRCSSSTASTSRPSRRCGTRSGCAATSPGRSRWTGSIPADQIVGPIGDGAASNDEAVDPWFLVGSSRSGTASRWERSTSPSATPRASATWTWACGWPTTRRFRTTWVRR